MDNKNKKGFLEYFGFKKKATETVKTQKRGFHAAKINNTNSNFGLRVSSFDLEIYNDLEKLRSRARDLSLNNDYAKKYF